MFTVGVAGVRVQEIATDGGTEVVAAEEVEAPAGAKLDPAPPPPPAASLLLAPPPPPL
jgi:hypothetical protein